MQQSKILIAKRMKRSRAFSRRQQLLAMAVANVAALACTSAVHADALTWDASSTAGVQDGAGTWDNTSLRWYQNGADTTWDNTANANSTAFFGEGSGSAGTINIVSTGITAGSITFDKAYTLGTASLGVTSNGADGSITLSGDITTDSGGTASFINAGLAGTVTTEGSGLVYLRGNNTGMTSLTLDGPGTVVAGGANNGTDSIARAYLGTGTVTLNSGTLLLQYAGTNGGTASFGGGTIALAGGTLSLTSGYGDFTNAVSVVSNSYINPQANNNIPAAFYGSATLNWVPTENNITTLSGNLTGFTGLFELGATTNAQLNLDTATGGNANFDLGTGNGEILNGVALSTINGVTNSNIVPIGSLNGGVNTLVGGYVNNSGGHTTYTIGGAGNSVFNGTIRNLYGDPVNKFHVGDFVGIDKVNSATSLTLSGYNSYSLATTVEAGTLLLDNSTQSVAISEAAVTANTSTGSFTLTSGTIPVGTVVTFGSNNSAASTAALDYPGGITALTTPYYVVASSGTSFQVSATPGGSVLVPSSTGTSVVVSASGALGATNLAVQLGDSGTQATDTIYLELGGAYTMARPISVNADGQLSTTIGNTTDTSGAFSGTLTLNNNVTVAQAAAGPGSTSVLTLSGIITTGSTGMKTLTSAGPGAIEATGTISNGTGSIGLLTTGGITTLTATNTFTGSTTVEGGTLIAGTKAPSGASGAFGNSASAITLGDANTTTNNDSPALLTGGSFTIARPITLADCATTGTYSIGGNVDTTSTFSGAITLNQPLLITQVANSGNDGVVNITGGIKGGTSGPETVTFAGPGSISVSGGAIADNGAATVSLTNSGGVTTLSNTSTYSGPTSVTGGTLNITGALTNSATVSLTGSSNLVLSGVTALPSAAIVNIGGTANAFVNAGQTLAAISSSGNATFTAGTSVIGQGSGVGTGAGGASTTGGISGTGTLTVNGTANLYAANITQSVLNIGATNTATIADSAGPGNASSVSVLTDLNNSGTLDLKNNDLIVTDSTQYSTIKALINNAADGGAWDQSGITSSSARANSSAYGLGYAPASAVGTSVFDGVTLAGTETIVKYTLLGDTQLRGAVGIGDYDTVLSNYGTGTDWSQGNFHYSGVVGIGDYDDVLSNYGAHPTGNLVVNPALTHSLSPALSLSPDAAKSDLKLEVNTTTGDVYLEANTSVAFTGYTISDPSAHLLGGSTSPDPAKLLSVSPGNGGNTNAYETGTTYINWFKISETSIQMSEGQNNNGFANHSSRDDTINIPAGGTIDFGDIYNTAVNNQDISFDFAEAGTTPTNGPAYYGAEVDYIGGVATPEPASVSLLAIGAVGMLARRRRKTTTSKV